MKKKPTPLEWLDRILLTSPYCYALCLSEGAFLAELRRLKVPEKSWSPWLKNKHCGATIHYFERTEGAGLCAIVCMSDNPKVELEQKYALMVHEAVHLWREIKENIGEHRPAAEEEAYAIQCISQSLMYSYKEQTAKRKKK